MKEKVIGDGVHDQGSYPGLYLHVLGTYSLAYLAIWTCDVGMENGGVGEVESGILILTVKQTEIGIQT